jgi:Zn-dependent protease
MLFEAFQLNIVLFLFNLIPVPPLDGSHILGAMLPSKFLYAYENFTRQYAMIGLIVVFIFGGRIIAGPAKSLSDALLGVSF